MPIIHIEKRDRWSSISNATLEDARLSFKARGLLAYLLSKQASWSAHITELCQASAHDGEKSVRAALSELVEYGYASFERSRVQGRFVEGGWVIRELPSADFRHVEKRHVEKRHAENRDVYQRLNIVTTEERLKTEEENALPSVERPAHETYSRAQGDDASALHGASKPRKPPQLLAAEDWLSVLLHEYAEDFSIEGLNDNKWWTDVANSFPVFERNWVERAFSDLAEWLDRNPARRPRTPRGWKARMKFSLNYFYDKDQRRQAYAKNTAHR